MAKKTRKWVFIVIFLVALWLLSLFFAGIVSLFSGDGITGSLGANVAVISIKGVILTTKEPAFAVRGVTLSSDVVKFIRKAEKNPSVKAILLDINSPGGSAVASEEIADAVKKAKKFTVAVIRESGTSGAYWVASAADIIIANRVSITGSIGVVSSYLEFSGLLEKYGIEYQRLISGKYKDIGSPFRDMTPEEEKFFQERLDRIRDLFIDEIAENRNMSRKRVEKVAEGLFYLGEEAKELGLVDMIGNKEDALELIEEKFDIVAKTVEYKEKKGVADILSEVFSRNFFRIGEGIGSSLLNNRIGNDLRVYT